MSSLRYLLSRNQYWISNALKLLVLFKVVGAKASLSVLENFDLSSSHLLCSVSDGVETSKEGTDPQLSAKVNYFVCSACDLNERQDLFVSKFGEKAFKSTIIFLKVTSTRSSINLIFKSRAPPRIS